jgi:hypothetical protein
MSRIILFMAAFGSMAVLPGCPSNTNGKFDGVTDGVDGDDQPLPGPIIGDISPNRGPAAGGTVVEITGENFADGIQAFFGSAEAAAVTFINPALITATTPAGAPGPVTVRVENPDGQSSQIAGGFTYLEGEAIPWCAVDRPASAAVFTGEASEPFYGIVELPGRTGGPGQGDGITAQAGYGPDGTSPDDSGWTWVDAAYGADVDGAEAGDLARDEYGASLTAAAAGDYDVAFRFSFDGGATWTVCDMNASDFPGYSSADAAQLLVTGAPAIAFCILHQPTALTVTAGEATEEILGRLRIVGYTDVTSGGLDFVTAQVGYGPDGSDPASSTAWDWNSAVFDADTGSEDQYGGVLEAPTTTGSYDVAYRFSIDGGAAWTVCDTDGSDNGYDAAAAGSMTVEEPAVVVDWCKTQWPEETWTGPGFQTDPFYGRVQRTGVTEGAGQGPGILAQLGWGARATHPDTWSNWVDAGYFADSDYTGVDDADEYAAQLTVPAAGEYSAAFRFSADGGLTWTPCDLGGTDDGFSADATAYLRVVVTTLAIEWCNTQWPATLTVPLTGESDTVYGQVLSAGATSTPGRTMGIIAEVGYGPDGSDPASAAGWSWKRANFNVDVGSNDEFMGTLGGFSAAGAYDYAYRFTGDWGETWSCCDLNGSTDGYAPANAGSLTVE